VQTCERSKSRTLSVVI